MKHTRLTLPATMLAVALVLWNCGDASPVAPPSAPPPAPAVSPDLLGALTGTLGGIVNNIGLLSCPVHSTSTATATIGSAGGTITVGNHKLVIPAGALAHNVTITATAPAGNYNHVEFSPHGLQFSKSATLTMSYSNCGLVASLLPKHIAYTNSSLTQILSYLLGSDNLLQRKVTGKVDHFSDYVIAWLTDDQ